MALFGKGNSETLEVKLKLTEVPKINRQQPGNSNSQMERPASGMSHHNHRHNQHRRSESQQTRSFHQQSSMDASSEWNAFMQSNPNLGHTAKGTPIVSPLPPPARPENSTSQPSHFNYQDIPPPHHQHTHAHPHQQYQPPGSAPDGFTGSFQDSQSQQQPELPPLPHQSQQAQSQLPPPVPPPTSDAVVPEKPARSRPASRVRNKGPPKPRGRPKKKPGPPVEDAGHTSGAEVTDADDGPQPKRAKVTRTDYNTSAAFQSQPDSLRVAASTSGSLRNMRPVGAVGSGAAGSHLQEVPRAPTPVPNRTRQPRRGQGTAPRRTSMAEFESYQTQMETSEPQSQIGFRRTGHDARSPTDFNVASPDAGYTPEESPIDIGSSPPVPRTSAFIQSSPAPSSPILPPADSGFMSGGIDDYLEDDDVGQELPTQPVQADVLPALPVAKPKRSYRRRGVIIESDGLSICHEEPGPPRLLPTSTIIRPDGTPFGQSDAPASEPNDPSQSQPPAFRQGPPPPRELTPRPGRRGGFKRTNSAPVSRPVQKEPVAQQQHTLASFEVAIESVEMPDSLPPNPPSNKTIPAQLFEAVISGQQSQASQPIPRQEDLASTNPNHFQIAQGERSQAEKCQIETEQANHPSTMNANQTPSTADEGQTVMESSIRTTKPEADMGEAVSTIKTEPVSQQPSPKEAARYEQEQEQYGNAALGVAQGNSGANDLELLGTAIATAPMPQPTATTEPELPTILPPPLPPASQTAKSLSLPPVPASDPVQDTFLNLPPLPPVAHSEAPCPPSDLGEPGYPRPAPRRTAVKGRLEQAIEKGEMPPFCVNCGAIETPTWRKIWCQEHKGIPAFHEFSDKPGMVTTIDILERTAEGQPTLYRLVKKTLGPLDIKSEWDESLLCNRESLPDMKSSGHGLTGIACGIWLSKAKGHRPPDRWEKDASRLGVPRKRKDRGEGPKEPRPRSKRARTKNDGQTNPTSEAYYMTDPVGPGDSVGPDDRQEWDGDDRSRRQSTVNTENGYQGYSQEPQQPWQPANPSQSATSSLGGPADQGAPGSTHSRGSGTAQSPIALIEEDQEAAHEKALGATRRLLFPSPRKDGVPKVLGELDINVVTTSMDFQSAKTGIVHKENKAPNGTRAATPTRGGGDDLDQELFGTPPMRPSTPPPRSAKHGPFKTPTRPTPSHRPITRSVSRSMRSGQKTPTTMALFQLQQTPTQTPRSKLLGLSGSKSRTPRNKDLHAHFVLDTPFTATLNQLLSEANDFTSGSPAHGLMDIDLSALPELNSDDVATLANAGAMDFGNFLSAEMGLPSSPPMLRGHQMNFGNVLGADAVEDMWAKFSQDNNAPQGNEADAIE